MITANRLREVLHYSPRTGIFTARITRQGAPRGKVLGCLHKRSGQLVITIDGTCYAAHRLAWFYVKGRWPQRGLDHENTKPADNRLSNLRLATKSQNMHNCKPRKDGSGLKGVGRNSNSNKYRARITINGVQFHLGSFATAEEANAAYRSAAKKHFGKYAYKEQHRHDP